MSSRCSLDIMLYRNLIGFSVNTSVWTIAVTAAGDTARPNTVGNIP